MSSKPTIRPVQDWGHHPSPETDNEPLPAARPREALRSTRTRHPSIKMDTSQTHTKRQATTKADTARDHEWETYGPRLYTCPDIRRLRGLNARMDILRASQRYGSRNIAGHQQQQQQQQQRAMDPASLARQTWPAPPGIDDDGASPPGRRELNLWDLVQAASNSVAPEPFNPPGKPLNPMPREERASDVRPVPPPPRQAAPSSPADSGGQRGNAGKSSARGGIFVTGATPKIGNPRVKSTKTGAISANEPAATPTRRIKPGFSIITTPVDSQAKPESALRRDVVSSDDIYDATPGAATFDPSVKFTDIDQERVSLLRPGGPPNDAYDQVRSSSSASLGGMNAPRPASFRARAVQNWSRLFFHGLVHYDEDGIVSIEEQQPGRFDFEEGCSTCSEDFRFEKPDEKEAEPDNGKGKETEEGNAVGGYGGSSPVNNISSNLNQEDPIFNPSLHLELLSTGPSLTDTILTTIYAEGAESSSEPDSTATSNKSSNHVTRHDNGTDSRSDSPPTSPLADDSISPNQKGKERDLGSPSMSSDADRNDDVPASRHLDDLTAQEIEGSTPLHLFMLKSVQATQAAARDIRHLRSALAAKDEQLAIVARLMLPDGHDDRGGEQRPHSA